MAALAMGDEIEAGLRRRMARDLARIDAFSLPQGGNGIAERIIAELADIGAVASEPCGSDDDIRCVAAETGKIPPVRLLVEFVKRLAKRDDINLHGADAWRARVIRRQAA